MTTPQDIAAIDTTHRPVKAAVPGMRERNKSEKDRRIRQAAREVFIEHGYEAATTREIAARADVSIGTVFVYARDKRDLLLQIVNDDLDAVGSKAGAVAKRPGPLLKRLLAFFKLRYAYWAREPSIARPALRETFDFLESASYVDRRGAGRDRADEARLHGKETRRFYERRPLIIAQIEQLIADAQQRGEVAAGVPAGEFALIIFNLYLIEVRRWLTAEAPQADKGIKRLGVVLELVLRGAIKESKA